MALEEKMSDMDDEMADSLVPEGEGSVSEFKPVAFARRSSDPLHYQRKGSTSDLFASRFLMSELSRSSLSPHDFHVVATAAPFVPAAFPSLPSARSVFGQRIALKAYQQLDSLSYHPFLQDFDAPFRPFSDYKSFPPLFRSFLSIFSSLHLFGVVGLKEGKREVMVRMMENALSLPLIEKIGGIPRPVRDVIWRYRGIVNFPLEDKRYHWSDYVSLLFSSLFLSFSLFLFFSFHDRVVLCCDRGKED